MGVRPATPSNGLDGSCLRVQVERLDGLPIVHLIGEVDMSSVEQAAQPIRREMMTQPAALVLDLLLVTFFGSSGLQLLVSTRARADASHTDLRLVIGRVVRLSMEIVGLVDFFAVHATVTDAVAGAKQAA